MKKKLFLNPVVMFMMFIVAFCLWGKSTVVQASAKAPYIKFGDVNFDGKIDDTDVEMILRHRAVVESNDNYVRHPDWYLRNKAFLAGDVNGDRVIDTTDILILLRHIAAQKGEAFISSIVTVTLMDDQTGSVYDCFPIIYYYRDASKNNYPYLQKPVKRGYTFAGWNTSPSSYGTKISSYSRVTNTEDHILYPQWSVNSYRLSFDANGGSCSSTYFIVKYKSRYGVLPTPTRKGHTFTGWYTSKAGGNKVNSDGLMNAYDITVYAHWRANSYILYFNANGGSSPETSRKVTYDCAYGSLPTPTAKGYTFLGWYTSKSGGNVVSSNTRMGTGEITLYARWKASTYVVAFDPCGATCREKSKNVTYGKPYGRLPNLTKSRNQFQGWYTKKSGGTRITDKTKVTITSNQKLYAHWKAETEVKLNRAGITLQVKKTQQMKVTVKGKNGRKIWTSSNPGVASVNSTGKVTAKKAGTANITVRVNGFMAVCKVTVVNPPEQLVSFKSLRGKSFTYKNSKYSFGIGFGKTNNNVYIGVWNLSGTSSSYEDFCFEIKEGTYIYQIKGCRSGYVYRITVKPHKDYVKVGLACENFSYSYYNITNQTFKYKANSICAYYAERWHSPSAQQGLEITNYFHGAGGPNTVSDMNKLADNIGGMGTGRNTKYPHLYRTGNKMLIGVNNNPVYGTSRDEYIRSENTGNTKVLFYGVKIGDTRQQMETKFRKYNVRTWNKGISYSNANAWQIYPVFQNGKLIRYTYLCKPTG